MLLNLAVVVNAAEDNIYRFDPDHPDPNLAGAFLNSRSRVKNGSAMVVNRDVGTAFGIRFLARYYDYTHQ